MVVESEVAGAASFRKEDNATEGTLAADDGGAGVGAPTVCLICPSMERYSVISVLRCSSMMDCQTWHWNSPGSKSCDRLGKAMRRDSSYLR